MAQPITVNTSDYDLIRARQELFAGMGLDQKRPTAWSQYGYPETITFDLLLRAYERGGAGNGAVHRILEKCWQVTPRIKKPDSDDESPWEQKVNTLLSGINAWQKLQDFDRRNMVGRFAALIYRIGDGKALNEPLATGQKLVDLVPVYESQIRVQRWNEDPTSEEYGQPLEYQIETAPPNQQNDDARPRTWIKVHPSRVQILAEGAVGSNFYDGVPLLRAGFNQLVDIEKISGGSAESFLKNSARTIVFEYDPQASVQAIVQSADGTVSTKSVREVHEEQTRRLNRNQDASIVMQGGKANSLQTQTSDPTLAFETAASLFAASVRIPFTILFGQQTGRLASDEDRADMIERCKARQKNELTPAIEQLIRRLQAAGLIEAGDFEVEWPDIGAPSDEQKLDNALKMASINKTLSESGVYGGFDANEVRRAGGYEDADGMDGMPTGDEIRAAEEAERKAAADAAAKAAKAAGAPPAAKP